MEHLFPDPPQEVNITEDDVSAAVEEEIKATGGKDKDPHVLRELMLEREEAMSRGGSGRSSVAGSRRNRATTSAVNASSGLGAREGGPGQL
jgi:hypothetical protein